MRLSDTEIIAGLRHPSVLVREEVATYLDAGLRTGPEITPHLIAAVDEFGWKDVLNYPHRIAEFELDEQSLPWALDQIERHTDGSELHLNVRWHLARMVSNAPPRLLRLQLDRILESSVFREQHAWVAESARTYAELVQLRCNLADKTPGECWDLLDEHCRSVEDVEEFEDADIPYLELLVERIAAGPEFREPVLESLASLPKTPRGYEEWYVGAMIRLAGRLRLEPAIPLVYSRFDVGWDWYNEEVMKALIMIGTPAVTAFVSSGYPGSPSHIKIYSQGVLENVHHDNSVSDILRLLPQEHDDGFRGELGIALASHFDDAAIEPALAVYDEHPEDKERIAIIERLFAHAQLAGMDLPQLGQWEEMLKDYWRDPAIHGKWSGSLSEYDDLLGDVFWEDDLLFNEDSVTSGSQDYLPKQESIIREVRVGRNERCPCGSGKKYKNCCLRSAPK